MKKLTVNDSKRVIEALLNQELHWDLKYPTMHQSSNAGSATCTTYQSDPVKLKSGLTFIFEITELNGHTTNLSFIIENGGTYEASLQFLVDESLLFDEKYENRLDKLITDIKNNDYMTEIMNWMDKAALGGPVE